ncbi:MAG: lipid II flippase MurJ, partial [Alphaproteobacteria bacterium]|nr:lipid II flippase MurJ [Alphaproteobacteria bacterium]
MFRKFASVSGFTLLSRLTGFLRDVAIASMLGSGLAADAYFVAQRLPNHFRAIFGEGAFNSAFVPSYAREISEAGNQAAVLFSGRILTLLTAVLVPLCVLAMWQMPLVIDLLAPGFADEPEKYALAVTLTRITFPY